MNRITDVVKNLLIINVIVFFGVRLLPQGLLPEFNLYSPQTGLFKPFQIITHLFMHADERHLFFNMLSLFFLGPMVEEYIGSKKFFILYFFSGLMAVAFHFGFQYFNMSPMWMARGASGAVYGVMAAFATLFPHRKLMLLIPPVPIKSVYLVIGLVAYDLYASFSGARPGIATFAHVGGAFMGFLMIRYWRKKGF